MCLLEQDMRKRSVLRSPSQGSKTWKSLKKVKESFLSDRECPVHWASETLLGTRVDKHQIISIEAKQPRLRHQARLECAAVSSESTVDVSATQGGGHTQPKRRVPLLLRVLS